VPVFPALRNGQKTMRRDVASRWLLKAENMAGLPKLRHGVSPLSTLLGQGEKGPPVEGRRPRRRLEGHRDDARQLRPVRRRHSPSGGRKQHLAAHKRRTLPRTRKCRRAGKPYGT
jgi:hypothetical protein